jgi:DNA-binding transcriptional ArsR family regulator
MEPKRLIVIKDPEVAKLFSDPLRRQIVHLSTHKELSAADLVKELGKNYSSIVYHIRLLEEAGLIEKVREDIVQNKIQPFYRATAWSFHVSYYLNDAMATDEEYKNWQEDLYDRLLNGLEGYKVEVPEGKEQRIRELLRVLYMAQKKEFEGRIDLRKTDHQLEPHVGRTLAHTFAYTRLFRDEEARKAAEELAEILKL